MPLADLAAGWGTRLLVVDLSEIRARLHAVRDAFPRVAFALKALSAHSASGRAHARRFRTSVSAGEATHLALDGDRVIGSVGLVREPPGPTHHVASS